MGMSLVPCQSCRFGEPGKSKDYCSPPRGQAANGVEVGDVVYGDLKLTNVMAKKIANASS